jgi:hypothetical protein
MLGGMADEMETKDVHTASGGTFETKNAPGYVPAAVVNVDRSNMYPRHVPDAPDTPGGDQESSDEDSASTTTESEYTPAFADDPESERS